MMLVDQPFPGLRAFDPDEGHLFFGREDHCDELLARLDRRRVVAVVGLSGSGKSSLVLAGLIPALERGYLPSAGSSWQIYIVRPGNDPLENLALGLTRPRNVPSPANSPSLDEIRQMLNTSSFGLVEVAGSLVGTDNDSILLVVDQFEELFRFKQQKNNPAADEAAMFFVQLLLSAAAQTSVPLYLVFTMRSDYLGDCAQFSGLAETLNDSQYLVPHLTRDQLREAIEFPIAAGGAKVTPRLVQQLLQDVDALSRSYRLPSGPRQWSSDDQDQLPLLQHALMRVWQASAADRAEGKPIDLPHYEDEPVKTIEHALDRHADEAFNSLPSDRDRAIARRMFQRLAERDAENREVRRSASLDELAAVASDAAGDDVTDEQRVRTLAVVKHFAAPGRTFVRINDQLDVDVSHESLIRRWSKYRTWLDEEARSRRTFSNLADAAFEKQSGGRSYYRGPELALARSWWRRERPTKAWAKRYGGRFDLARTFLQTSWLVQIGRRTAVVLALATIPLAAFLVQRARLDAQSARLETQEARLETQEARLAEQSARLKESAVQAEGQKQVADLQTQLIEVIERSTKDQKLLDEIKRKSAQIESVKQGLATRAVEVPYPSRLPVPISESSANAVQSAVDRATKAEAELDKTQKQLTAVQGQLTGAVRDRDALQSQINSLKAAASNTDSDDIAIRRLFDVYAHSFELWTRPFKGKGSRLEEIYPSQNTIADERARLGRAQKAELLSLTANVMSIKTEGHKATVEVQFNGLYKPVGVPAEPENFRRRFAVEKQNGQWVVTSTQDVRQ